MESTSDSRFDPNYVAQLLLEISHEHSQENLLQKLVQRVVERTTYVNRRMAEMLGYEPEEMAGRAWPPCFVHQGEPFAGCLWMRRHRAGEGVWL